MLFSPEEKGQGLVEYALIIIFVVLVVIVALTVLGQTIRTDLYDRIIEALPGT